MTKKSEVIVCATDFSPQADAALAWAAAVARRDGAVVDLVYVAPVSHENERMLVFDSTQFDAAQVADASERLQTAARTASQELDVSVRPQVLRGQPHEKILEHAREEDAVMIVLGTCGLAAVERWMLGSVADRTVRSADRPVVVVPRAPEGNVWAPRASVATPRPPRVVAGLGDADDHEVVRFVAGLRRAAPVDVTFVHLYWPIGEYERLGLPGPRDLFSADPEIVKNLEPRLREEIAGLPGQGAVALDVRPAWGEPSSNLLVAVEDVGADLLVVGAHARPGLGRLVNGTIAKRLSHQSRYVPIAVVPVPAPVETAGRAGAIPAYRAVLAATDLSPLGNAAVAHAYSLLRGAGGVVELCYVHEHVLPSPSYAYALPEQALSDVDRARLIKELRGLTPRDAAARGISTHVTIVDGGKPAEAIVQAAERLGVDAITLASHGRGGVARVVLGSVAEEVVRRARRPVLVVRNG